MEAGDRGEAAPGSDGDLFAVVQDAEVGVLDDDRDALAGVAGSDLDSLSGDPTRGGEISGRRWGELTGYQRGELLAASGEIEGSGTDCVIFSG